MLAGSFTKTGTGQCFDSRHGAGGDVYDHATLWVHAVKEFDMPTGS
jgi:hypothetical protein